MNAFPVLLSALSAAVLGPSASDFASPDQRDENVLVTTVTDDPCCGSGVIAFAVGFSGRLGEEERAYFIPFMAPGQARPRVGERCAIGWRRWQSNRWHWRLADGGRIWRGRQVTDFSCRRPGPPSEREP